MKLTTKLQLNLYILYFFLAQTSDSTYATSETSKIP